MRSALFTIACAAALLAAGCDTRTRENPFDPLNPNTAGRPEWLTAGARDGFVDLRWVDGGLPGIEGFTVLRGLSPDTLEVVTEVPPGYRLFRDVGLARGVTYYFAVGFRFHGQEPLLTAIERATPGPDVPWALDEESSPLALLSADGRAVLSREAPGADLVDLSVEPSSGRAWCVDYARGRAVVYNKDGNLDRTVSGFAYPTRISVDLLTGGAWIVSFDEGTLTRYDTAGRISVVDTALVGPLDVEASPIGGCWVSDMLGLVHRYSPTGEHETVAQVARPSALSIAPDNSVWLTDPVEDEVVKVSTEGVIARAGGFDGPFGVAATPDGGCWVADRERVCKVDSDGSLVLTVEGFKGARSVAFNTRTGECWVADALGDGILKIGEDGAIEGDVTPVTGPFVIAGRWGSPSR
jgi:sugar lactone lactonase YvrE